MAKDINKMNKQYGQAIAEATYYAGRAQTRAKSKGMEDSKVKDDISTGNMYLNTAKKIESNQWKLMANVGNRDYAGLISEPKTRQYLHKGETWVQRNIGLGGAIGGAITGAVRAIA